MVNVHTGRLNMHFKRIIMFSIFLVSICSELVSSNSWRDNYKDNGPKAPNMADGYDDNSESKESLIADRLTLKEKGNVSKSNFNDISAGHAFSRFFQRIPFNKTTGSMNPVSALHHNYTEYLPSILYINNIIKTGAPAEDPMCTSEKLDANSSIIINITMNLDRLRKGRSGIKCYVDWIDDKPMTFTINNNVIFLESSKNLRTRIMQIMQDTERMAQSIILYKNKTEEFMNLVFAPHNKSLPTSMYINITNIIIVGSVDPTFSVERLNSEINNIVYFDGSGNYGSMDLVEWKNKKPIVLKINCTVRLEESLELSELCLNVVWKILSMACRGVIIMVGFKEIYHDLAHLLGKYATHHVPGNKKNGKPSKDVGVSRSKHTNRAETC